MAFTGYLAQHLRENTVRKHYLRGFYSCYQPELDYFSFACKIGWLENICRQVQMGARLK